MQTGSLQRPPLWLRLARGVRFSSSPATVSEQFWGWKFCHFENNIKVYHFHIYKTMKLLMMLSWKTILVFSSLKASFLWKLPEKFTGTASLAFGPTEGLHWEKPFLSAGMSSYLPLHFGLSQPCAFASVRPLLGNSRPAPDDTFQTTCPFTPPCNFSRQLDSHRLPSALPSLTFTVGVTQVSAYSLPYVSYPGREKPVEKML